jgi:hypothetical protein
LSDDGAKSSLIGAYQSIILSTVFTLFTIKDSDIKDSDPTVWQLQRGTAFVKLIIRFFRIARVRAKQPARSSRFFARVWLAVEVGVRAAPILQGQKDRGLLLVGVMMLRWLSGKLRFDRFVK